MPSRKRSDGTYQDIAHPISRESRMVLEHAIIKEYDRVVRASTLIAAENADGFSVSSVLRGREAFRGVRQDVGASNPPSAGSTKRLP